MDSNIIKAIADKYGENILFDGKRLSGLIADYIPKDKKARNLFNTAIRDKIPQKLSDIKLMDEAHKEMQLKGLCIRFMDDNSLTEEAAYNTIKCFAYAFGFYDYHDNKESKSANTKPKSAPPASKDENIVDLGLIDRKGDWIYYQNGNDGNTLYKMHKNGSGRTKLNNDWSYSIHVSGNWVYYCNLSDGENLYKIRIDGKDKTKLNNDKSLFISVSGDWVYYSNWSDGEKLYKVRVDGKGRIKLNNDECQNINAVGDWVYYINCSNGRKRYKIYTDGTQRQIAE